MKRCLQQATTAGVTISRDRVRCGEATIEYRIRRSSRRKKTISLTVDRDGVHIAAPSIATDDELREFAMKHAAWILQRQKEFALAPDPLRFVTGEAVPYLGRDVPLIVEHAEVAARRVTLDNSLVRIAVPADLADDERREVTRDALATWYRARAAERLPEAVERWWARLGHGPAPPVLVRDQRKRWGSCGSDGVIRLNWRLVMLDRSLIDYIVVHELSHLRVRNHSPAFWTLVAQSIPDMQQRHRRLKELGMRLPL